MGWTSVTNQVGTSTLEMLKTHSQFYAGYSWEGPDNVYKVVDVGTGAGGAYGVVEKTSKASGHSVNFAIAIKISRKGSEFCWKEMTEFEGPYMYGIPNRLLAKLSPPSELGTLEETKNLREWRQAVQQQKALKAVKVKPYDVLIFNEPASFTIDDVKHTASRFRVISWGRKKVFEALCDTGTSFFCRLSNYYLKGNFVVE